MGVPSNVDDSVGIPGNERRRSVDVREFRGVRRWLSFRVSDAAAAAENEKRKANQLLGSHTCHTCHIYIYLAVQVSLPT